MVTKEIVRQRLEMYLEAERKILLSGQSYKIGERELTRADLKEVRLIIDDLTTTLDALERKRGGQKRAVFI